MNRLNYFTGTGNSLAITGELASRLGGAKVEPMTKVLRGVLSHERRKAGIAAPLRAMPGLPALLPGKAIQHGKKMRTRARYRHPQCPAASLRLQAEAK